MTDEPMSALDAALLAYSMEELDALGAQQRPLLFARVARELEAHPQPDAERMRELRRQMELTHFHPAIMAARKPNAAPKLSEELFWDAVRRLYPEWLCSDASNVLSERIVCRHNNGDGTQTVVFETEESDDDESDRPVYGYRFRCVMAFEDGAGWNIADYSVEEI